MKLAVLSNANHEPEVAVHRLLSEHYPELDDIWDRGSWWIAKKLPLVLRGRFLSLKSIFEKDKCKHYYLMQRLGYIYYHLRASRMAFAEKFTIYDRRRRKRIDLIVDPESSPHILLNHIDSEIQTIRTWFTTLSDHKSRRAWNDVETIKNDEVYKDDIRDGVNILGAEQDRCVDMAGNLPESEIVKKYGNLLPSVEELCHKPHFFEVKLSALQRWHSNEEQRLATFVNSTTAQAMSPEFRQLLDQYASVWKAFAAELIWKHLANLAKPSYDDETPKFIDPIDIRNARITQALLNRLRFVISATDALAKCLCTLVGTWQGTRIEKNTQAIIQCDDISNGTKREALKKCLESFRSAVNELYAEVKA